MADDFKQIFIDETLDLLSDLEISLLELERKPCDSNLIAKVFRSLHTIKGSSGMFGFPRISEFTHNIETIFHHVRCGEIKITKEIIDLTLLARDQISLMLASENNDYEQRAFAEKEILSAIRIYIPEYSLIIKNSRTN